ncbi:hypothetical protein ACVJMY_005633 [Bradyrhizobium diazoefficiens]
MSIAAWSAFTSASVWATSAPLRIGLLLGAGVGGGELLVAGEVNALVGELGLVLRLLGDRLIVRRLIERWIDLADHVALLDVLAFGEIDRDQLAVDLRAHGHGVERADRADAVEIDRDVLDAGRCRQHRHRQIGALVAAVRLLRLLMPHGPAEIAEAAEDRERDQSQDEAAARRFPHRPRLRVNLLIRLKEH